MAAAKTERSMYALYAAVDGLRDQAQGLFTAYENDEESVADMSRRASRIAHDAGLLATTLTGVAQALNELG